MTEIDQMVMVVNSVLAAQKEARDRNSLMIWTIYNHPKDYPSGFIARAFEVTKEGSVATSAVLVDSELKPIQDIFIQAGLTRMIRNTGDDYKIVESWL